MKSKIDPSDTGKIGEDAAANYLSTLGYRIIERNFRQKYGEIDLVAIEGSSLVFVEVKTRTNDKFGTPEESISNKKLQKIYKTVDVYQSRRINLPENVRLDMVAVYLTPFMTVKKIVLYKDVNA